VFIRRTANRFYEGPLSNSSAVDLAPAATMLGTFGGSASMFQRTPRQAEGLFEFLLDKLLDLKEWKRFVKTSSLVSLVSGLPVPSLLSRPGW
jgi:hypothetical protein